jgi:hypothetical protein
MADKKLFDSSLQDVVYSIDVGAGLKILRIGLYILLLLVVVLIYTATQFWGLSQEEAMDLSQLGRNFSFTEGLVTKNISPFTMNLVEGIDASDNPRIGQHPDLIHPPAYPMLLSFGFQIYEWLNVDPFAMELGTRILPAERWIIVPLNHLFTMLTGLLIFSIGKHLFYREIGFLSMTIFYLSDSAWSQAITGLNLSMAIFFSVAAFRSAIIGIKYRVEERNFKRFWICFVTSAVLCGVAFYTRYLTVVIVPAIALYFFLMNGKFRGGIRYFIYFVVLFLMMMLPWLLRNYQLCGNPFGWTLHTALLGSPAFPDMSLLRDYQPSLSFGVIMEALKEKWVLNYSEAHRDLIPGLGGGVLMSFFITTFFYKFTRPTVNRMRNVIGFSLLLMVFLAGFFAESSMQLIELFWPFVILFGVAFFYILLDRLDLQARLYVVAMKCFLIALTLIPLGLRILPPHAKQPYPPYYPPMISYISNMLTSREILCTDMPWATAWYGDRISILLPKDIEQFFEINDYKQYISGIYFTPLTKNKPFVSELLDGPEKSWLPILSGRMPADFPLKAAVALNRQDQLFVSDRNRWSNDTGQAETTSKDSP